MIDRRELRIDNDYHRTGETVFVESHAMRQALAWRVAAELVRRHPDDMRVVETHPGGGQYDCVTLNARATGDDATWPGGWRTVVQMNKATPGDHLTHEGWFSAGGDGPGSQRYSWLEVLLCPDIRADVVAPLERAEGLTSPSATPATTSGSVGVRLLAAFTERTMLNAKPWTLVNGVLDSSGGDGGVREDLFLQLPGLDEDRRTRRDDDLFGVPEYRYWFVVEGDRHDNGPVRLAVDTIAGVAFTNGGPVQLMQSYGENGRHIDAVASRICPAAH